jgi:hypothetical protein
VVSDSKSFFHPRNSCSPRSRSDDSRFEPEDDGGDDDHRAVVDRALLVARG